MYRNWYRITLILINQYFFQVFFHFRFDRRWSRGHKLWAKDTKKSEAKDRLLEERGQIFLRPRTGMLETKDTRRKCSPKKKKKRPQTNFSSDLKKKDLSRRGRFCAKIPAYKKVFGNFPRGFLPFFKVT